MKVLERFLNYVKFDTTSNEDVDICPSSQGQRELASYIVKEMLELGVKDACLDDNGYVYGTILSNIDKNVPTFGFIAHFH